MLRVGNAQAFWGDNENAAATLLKQQPDIDYITLDYLSEVSLSIMAIQRAKDPEMGYARDFVRVIETLIPFWQQGSKVKIITNAGGLDPKKCALACMKALQKGNCTSLRIGIVSGDDVLEMIQDNPQATYFANMETKASIVDQMDHLATANAYLGAKPIVEALQQGADIVITGRIADPSLTVAPCVFQYGWKWDSYDQLAQATVAGHLIECGTQVTGGIDTDWLNIPNVGNVGFPFIEMESSGKFTLTKPVTSGGRVTVDTVKEQLLYELGDPAAYLSPDVTVSILNLHLKQDGENRVVVEGALGTPPPSTYKVSATYRDGFKAEGLLAIVGKQADVKARRCGEIILERVRQSGYELERHCIECLGAGDVVPGVFKLPSECLECVLRICVADHRIEAMECFSRQIAPLVTSGPQGTTGYVSGRPHIRPVFGYWPCLIPVDQVNVHVEVLQ